MRNNYKIRIFFGNTGCGKSTYGVYAAHKAVKELGYDRAYCNYPVKPKYAKTVDLDGLGKWSFPHNSYVIIDESGIEYNSRKFKTFPMHTIKWFKKHRHHRCSVDLFSQSWEDTDKIIRDLAHEYWYMFRITPWFTFCRKMRKKFTIDKLTHQPITAFQLTAFGWLFLKLFQWIPGWSTLFPKVKEWEIIFLPRWWHGQDSWSVDPNIEIRDFDYPLKKKSPMQRLSSLASQTARRLLKGLFHRGGTLLETAKTRIKAVFNRASDEK